MHNSMEKILDKTTILINVDLKEGTTSISSSKLKKIRKRLMKILNESTKYETET